MFARILSSNNALIRGLVFGTVGSAALVMTAFAQPGPGGPGGPGRPGAVSPELRAKVTAAEVKTVAADLKLDTEKSDKLAAAYAAHQKAAAEDRPERGAGRPDFKAMRKRMDDRRANLETSLTGFLDESQAKAAADVLGGYIRGWDRLVAVILGFGLEAPKEAEALGHTLTYVKAGVAARANMKSREDFAAVRMAMTTARKTLDDSIAPLLSDAQKAEWTKKTSRGPRGDRGGREGRGGRGDRRGDR